MNGFPKQYETVLQIAPFLLIFQAVIFLARLEPRLLGPLAVLQYRCSEFDRSSVQMNAALTTGTSRVGQYSVNVRLRSTDFHSRSIFALRRPIGHYRRSKHRESVTSLKMARHLLSVSRLQVAHCLCKSN